MSVFDLICLSTNISFAKNYSFILGYEIWSNSLISECQKWCSGTQYLGKKDETDSIEPSYKEGLHMSAFYLVTKSTTTKVHHEYLIYDFIGTYINNTSSFPTLGYRS